MFLNVYLAKFNFTLKKALYIFAAFLYDICVYLFEKSIHNKVSNNLKNNTL